MADAGLLDRRDGQADHHLRADQPPGQRRGQVFLAEVEPIRLEQRGDVGRVVHDEERVDFSAERLHSLGLAQEFPPLESLRAKLYDPRSGPERLSQPVQ